MSEKCSLEIREDGSQSIDYFQADFFVHMCAGSVRDLEGTSADAHWHEEIELISVLSGRMMFNVNGSIERINAGEGILVNSRQMHYSYPDNGADCDYIVLLLHPMLLCVSEQAEAELVNPIIEDRTLPYVLLDQEDSWKQDVLAAIHEIYNCRDLSTAPLRIQGLFCQIWTSVLEHAEICRRYLQAGKPHDKRLSTLKTIINFIHGHYRERITLEDLAGAGYISKSHCASIFRQYLHDSPINYLIKYRLKLSENLLTNSTTSITNVAYQVGFTSASFFIETFRKFYGCTPLEYRQEHWREELKTQTNALKIKIG